MQSRFALARHGRQEAPVYHRIVVADPALRATAAFIEEGGPLQPLHPSAP